MKKLLIINSNMHIGGVQKALVSLLWNIREQYDVTLLLFHKAGQCYKDIPPGVKVITAKSAYRFLGMTKHDIRSFADGLGRSFFAAITRIFGRKYAIALMALGQKPIRGYDVAISYFHNNGDRAFYGGCNEFTLKHVKAKKKIAFFHGDFMLCGANTPDNIRQYQQFDLIAACSEGCARSLLKGIPALGEKVQVVYNCHRFDEILRDAQAAPVALGENVVNLVTVARLGKEKGVERALRVIARLKPYQQKLHYYIIGDGIQEPLLRQIIAQEKLHGCVTLCGSLTNPYGYIQAADLLLIPSYSEAAPLVIGEAACLGTPILSMNTSSAKEMIQQTDFGWVCDNSEEAMEEALAALLADPDALHRAKTRLTGKTLSNEKAVCQFAALI